MAFQSNWGKIEWLIMMYLEQYWLWANLKMQLPQKHKQELQ